MFKKFLLVLTIIATMLATIIPMAQPALAQIANSVNIDLTVDENQATPTSTVHYSVHVVNSNIPGAHDAYVDVGFSPPGPTGAENAYGTPTILTTNLFLTVGSSVTFNYDGSGGAIMVPALAVDLGAVPLNAGVTVVYAEATFFAEYIYSEPYNGSGEKNVPLTILQTHPNTDVGISANPPSLPPTGGNVQLTITEDNTGDIELTAVSVSVTSSPNIFNATLNSSSPNFSGDTDGDGKLDTNETWQWVTASISIPPAPPFSYTFTAVGTGTEQSTGKVITSPTYPGELDFTVVPLVQTPASSKLTAGLLIGGIAALMGAIIIWRSRRLQLR